MLGEADVCLGKTDGWGVVDEGLRSWWVIIICNGGQELCGALPKGVSTLLCPCRVHV